MDNSYVVFGLICYATAYELITISISCSSMYFSKKEDFDHPWLVFCNTVGLLLFILSYVSLCNAGFPHSLFFVDALMGVLYSIGTSTINSTVYESRCLRDVRTKREKDKQKTANKETVIKAPVKKDDESINKIYVSLNTLSAIAEVLADDPVSIKLNAIDSELREILKMDENSKTISKSVIHKLETYYLPEYIILSKFYLEFVNVKDKTESLGKALSAYLDVSDDMLKAVRSIRAGIYDSNAESALARASALKESLKSEGYIE